jgi:putative phosphoesterase
MKIGIVSDSHDDGRSLAAAIVQARDWGAQAILHCGDVIGPNTLRASLALGVPLHVVHGNNLGDLPNLMRLALSSEGLLTYYGGDADFELGGRRIFLIHYPHLARGMAATGDYDAVFCGHSHEAAVETIDNARGGRTLLVNPGTVAGLGAPATFAVGDLADLRFDVRRLEN